MQRHFSQCFSMLNQGLMLGRADYMKPYLSAKASLLFISYSHFVRLD